MNAKEYESFWQELNQALSLAGREPEELKVIAVSKTRHAEEIRHAHALGFVNFGENYLQEALPKQQQLDELSLEWHFIGRLQSNKAKDVVGRFAWIHSVDRLSVVQKLESTHRGSRQNLLLQVNVAGQEEKAGVSPEAAPEIIDQILDSPHLRLGGLMTMPPLGDGEKRRYFAELRELAQKLSSRLSPPHDLNELSMGTSHDYMVAVEEGATMIRVGTLIFGPRPAKDGV